MAGETPDKSFLLPFIRQIFPILSDSYYISLFNCYSTKRTAVGNILMLLENKFLMVYEPWLIISHLKEKREYFSTGPASGT